MSTTVILLDNAVGRARPVLRGAIVGAFPGAVGASVDLDGASYWPVSQRRQRER